MAELHDFDQVTRWCKRCGIAASEAAVNSDKGCIANAENVTAISHIVRGHQLKSSLAALILLERRGFFKPDDSA